MKKLSHTQKKGLDRSKLVAQQAANCEAVIQFRREVLQSKLLSPDDVGAWIARMDATDRLGGNELVRNGGFIEWGQSGWVNKLPLRSGGVLHQLYFIAKDIADEFGWQKA